MTEAIKAAIDGAGAYLTDHPDEARYTDSVATARLEPGLHVRVDRRRRRDDGDRHAERRGWPRHRSRAWLVPAGRDGGVRRLAGRDARRAARDRRLHAARSRSTRESDDRGILGLDARRPGRSALGANRHPPGRIRCRRRHPRRAGGVGGRSLPGFRCAAAGRSRCGWRRAASGGRRPCAPPRGAPRRRAMAAIPTTGPSARRPKATAHPARSAGSSSPTPRMVTDVSRKPVAVCSASADPAVPAGASSLTAVENWAESATTLTPHVASTATSSPAGAPNRRPAATALDPDTAMAAIVIVVRPSRSARAPATTHPIPPAATTPNATPLAADGPMSAVAARLAATNDGNPRPHRVELPHVAQVADVGEAHRSLGEGVARHGQAEPCRRDGHRSLAHGHQRQDAGHQAGQAGGHRPRPSSRRRRAFPRLAARGVPPEPSVIAPMRMPTASPRSRPNQPASTLSATG